MSRPITWETIKGPDPNEAVQSMGLAAATIDKGFGGLVSAFDKYKTETKDRNTLEFMSELSKYQSPEALQTAMADGTIANLQQKYGSMLNSEVVTAPTDMLGKVLQQAVVKGQHDDANTRRDQLSLTNQLAFLSNTDPQAAAEFIKANPGLMDASQFADDMRATQQGMWTRDHQNATLTDNKNDRDRRFKLEEASRSEESKINAERLTGLQNTNKVQGIELSQQEQSEKLKNELTPLFTKVGKDYQDEKVKNPYFVPDVKGQQDYFNSLYSQYSQTYNPTIVKKVMEELSPLATGTPGKVGLAESVSNTEKTLKETNEKIEKQKTADNQALQSFLKPYEDYDDAPDAIGILGQFENVPLSVKQSAILNAIEDPLWGKGAINTTKLRTYLNEYTKTLKGVQQKIQDTKNTVVPYPY